MSISNNNYFNVSAGNDYNGRAIPPVNKDRATGFGIGGAAIGGLGTWFLLRKSPLLLRLLLPGVGAAVLGGSGYAGSVIYDLLQGTPYDTDKYKVPTKGGEHVVIGVSGAGDGPGGTVDRALRKKYGRGNYAMFRWNDRDKLKAYLRKLPENTKVTWHAHSYGVAPSFDAIKDYGRPIEELYTGDPVSWTERVDDKPANVKVWNNTLPSTLDPRVGHNWVGQLGGMWGARRGANNIKAKPIDGEQVGHGNYGGLVMGKWL